LPFPSLLNIPVSLAIISFVGYPKAGVSISKINSCKRPYEPKGAIAQAWSVAEVFRIISEN